MVGSTQTQIAEVEDLLRSVATVPSIAAATVASTRSWASNSRPVIAACLAVAVFAPGCAAAAVFLMRADGHVPPAVTPAHNPPMVAKADRLPPTQWSTEAIERVGLQDDIRLAAADANSDPTFLAPLLIRGSLEDRAIAEIAEPDVNVEAVVLDAKLDSKPDAKPRLKREPRRIKPNRIVAELPPAPEPPPPTFFERLFGLSH